MGRTDSFSPRPGERVVTPGRTALRNYDRWDLGSFGAVRSAVDLREPDEMIGAMYGDVGQRYRTNPNTGEILETKSVFISDGKMINQKTGATSNTTISAIISLRRISCSRRLELQPGVIVWENVYAKKPLSRHWFAGRYDARYARVNNYQLLVYAGLEMGRCFEGLSHRGEE